MSERQIRFDGKVVVVSGAGRGMGRCHARLFAERGAHVLVNDVDDHASREATEEIRKAGGSAIADGSDVVDEADSIVRRALGEWGRIDVLVNNAGVAHRCRFDTLEAAEFERVLSVHLLGTINLIRAAWPALQEVGGRVVNTSSGTVFGLAESTAYGTAKAAIIGLTRALANEPPPSTVRVNAILPIARTRMYEEAGGVTGSEEDRILSRLTPPDAVSPFVLYLASSEVAFNGDAFEVAGGLVSRVVYAQGPSVMVRSPEDALEVTDALGSGKVTVVDSLAAAVAAKLAELH